MDFIFWALLVNLPTPAPELHIIYRRPVPNFRQAPPPVIPGLPLGIGDTPRDLLEHRPGLLEARKP